LLAGCGPEGCSEVLMQAHGFDVEQLVELVRAGLAVASAWSQAGTRRKSRV
jgi:hypothetical protein